MALTVQELDYIREYIESKGRLSKYSEVAKKISALTEDQVRALIVESKTDRIIKIDRQIAALRAEKETLI